VRTHTCTHHRNLLKEALDMEDASVRIANKHSHTHTHTHTYIHTNKSTKAVKHTNEIKRTYTHTRTLPYTQTLSFRLHLPRVLECHGLASDGFKLLIERNNASVLELDDVASHLIPLVGNHRRYSYCSPERKISRQMALGKW